MSTQGTRRIMSLREEQGVRPRVAFTSGEGVGYNGHHEGVHDVARRRGRSGHNARDPPATTPVSLSMIARLYQSALVLRFQSPPPEPPTASPLKQPTLAVRRFFVPESTPLLFSEHTATTSACQHKARSLSVEQGQKVITAVARAYVALCGEADGVTPTAIRGRSRASAVAQARHLCAYLLAADYHLTNQAAGAALGRDHTTILHSRARITALLPRDPALRRLLASAQALLSGSDPHGEERHDRHHRQALAASSPQDWDEYRYWRQRALRAAATGGGVRDGL